MIILRENALVSEGDRISYNGENFNGALLTLRNGVVVERKFCKDGIISGVYASPYIDLDNSRSIIDSMNLDDEYEEPCTYQGRLYSGVAYKFDGDVCVSEREYEGGWLITEINYRRDGTYESVDVGDDEISQKCSWYEGGNVEEFESFKRGSYRFWVKFTEKNAITTLVIEGDYFSEVEKNRKKLAIDMFSNLDSFIDLDCADYFFISGSGVNDRVFNDIISHNGLDNTSRLRISKTEITPELFNELKPFKNINNIVIKSENVDFGDAKKIKSKMPECYIELNNEEVIV